MNIGIGFDVHPLVEGRKLVLGGVEIPFDKGLDGWSDADVLTHAIMDALLGAAAWGTSACISRPAPAVQGFSSLLLAEVKGNWMKIAGQIGNIDATVIAEKPRLREFIDDMREQLSQTLGIDIDQVSVKASTTNGLGFIGQGKASQRWRLLR